MIFQKHWIFVLLLVNILVLYILYAVIQQWNSTQVTHRNAFPEHNQLSRQRQIQGISNDGLDVSSVGEEAADADTKAVAGNYRHVLTKALSQQYKQLQRIAQKHPDYCVNNCKDNFKLSRRPTYPFFMPNFVVNETIFAVFEENNTVKECSGKIEIHNKHFGVLQDVVLHLQKWEVNGLIEAGRQLYKFKSHELRTDEAEVLKPVHGLLDMYCPGKHTVTFDNKTLENVLMLKYLWTHKYKTNLDKAVTKHQENPLFCYEENFTIAIERQDYANFYHIMLHMHSIFTMLIVFHKQPVNITILILDAHPKAEMDEMLETLYGPLVRVTELNETVKFQNLVLSLKESKSLLSKYWINSLPHLEEFRTFVFNQYFLNENHFFNCKRLTITFIWRRDKIWHPRNLKGSVQRKIFNEAEIYNAVYDKYPNVCLNGLLLESVPMKEQLKFIGKTDILIGMHGAGLTHTLFLPKTSGLIELFPQNFKKMFHYYKLFEVTAKRRGLHYLAWENMISEYEMPNYFTRVDPESFITVVDSMIKTLCHNHGQFY